MTKRIAALLCALLVLISGTFSAAALVAVQDENGVIHYSTDDDTSAATQPSPFKQWFRRGLDNMKSFWSNHGVLTVAILLVVCILGTVVILTIEDEKKKKQALEKQPKKKHKE